MFAFEVKDNFKKLSKANARSRKIRRHKPFSGITCGSKTTIYYSRTSIKNTVGTAKLCSIIEVFYYGVYSVTNKPDLSHDKVFL